ncbi:hypothetical protein ACH4XT_32020 [Streptomyces avidinii]|uniref:hypothetical protein n=1 Tax=Streptomyces avidinii TaxID=1895 RepID=UPI00379B90FF
MGVGHQLLVLVLVVQRELYRFDRTDLGTDGDDHGEDQAHAEDRDQDADGEEDLLPIPALTTALSKDTEISRMDRIATIPKPAHPPYNTAAIRPSAVTANDLLLAALAAHPPSPAQLDGASELFGTLEWTKVHDRHLPEPQRSMLIGHIQAEGTDAMRRRLSWGYYGVERTVD